MPKYHINPKTGNPGVCNASLRKCIYGEQTLHFMSKEAAREAFELSMEGAIIKGENKRRATRRAEIGASVNRNLDPVPFESFDELEARMTEQEKNEVFNKDTIVRDWYFDGRGAGLNHDAAIIFADDWDDYTEKRMDEEDFHWENEYNEMLDEFKTGKRKGWI